MSYLWQRFIHFVIAVLFLTIGIGLTIFVYSNTTSVNIDWWQFHYTNVPLGMVALIPLLVGVVLGYLYHVPAGLHDFTQSHKKSRRIGELEHELRELQERLDRLFGLPDDTASTPTPPAATTPTAPVMAEPRPLAKTRAIHEVKPVTEPATPAHPAKAEVVQESKPHGRGHTPEHPTHREPAPSA